MGPFSLILNRGITSLQDSIVTESNWRPWRYNATFGTLNVFRSVITNNDGGHIAGAIINEASGSVLVENSTIAHNLADGASGIFNGGSLVVRNSAIIFNRSGFLLAGGEGIVNAGFAEIVNTTIAKNSIGASAGGGIRNNGGGQVSILDSTIWENEGGGILNDGTVQIQNTIIESISRFWMYCGNFQSLGNNIIGHPTRCGSLFSPLTAPATQVLVVSSTVAHRETAAFPYYPTARRSMRVTTLLAP